LHDGSTSASGSKPDFDPTTAAAKAAWKKQVAAGAVPAHR
jgi:hypothetical protein